jgi:iron(III) transport system permease protein
LRNYVSIIQAPWLGKVLKNTFILMAAAPTLCVFLAALVAWVVHRTRISKKMKAIIDVLSFLPQATPSIVIALCLLLVFLYVRFIPIYGTVWIIVLASIIRYLPYSSRTIGAAVIQIHKELEESAQICRASEIRSFLKITLPLIAPAFVNAWRWVSMQSARALSAALMLYSSRNEVLSTRIWEIWYEGDITKVSALAVMMIAILLMVSLIGRMISAKLSHR